MKKSLIEPKPRKPITQKQFVVQALRRASYRWGPRNRALCAARVSRGVYRCAMCHPDNHHPKKGIRMDHVHPVVPVTGWDDWNGYVPRMLPEQEGWQVLCLEHHKIKTDEENAARKALRPVKEPFKRKTKKRAKKNKTT